MRVLVKKYTYSGEELITSRQGYLFHIQKCIHCNAKGHTYVLKSGNWRGGYRKCRECFGGDVLFYSFNGIGVAMSLPLSLTGPKHTLSRRKRRWKKRR